MYDYNRKIYKILISFSLLVHSTEANSLNFKLQLSHGTYNTSCEPVDASFTDARNLNKLKAAI